VTNDAISLIIEARERPVGNGVVHRLLPWRRRRMVGPFIFADHIGPDELVSGTGVDIDAHPHIGLSTLTYLFAGRLVHRDSTGAVETIEPGDVNWMTAGEGVTHTERSPAAERSATRTLHGLQSWVALPLEAENRAPRFEHHASATLPNDERHGTMVRVVAGNGWGMQSPVAVSSPLVLALLELSGDGSIEVDDSHPERAVLAIDGPVTLGGQRLPRGQLAVLAPGARPRLVGRGRTMVLGGEPVGPRHIWWNFVHSDRDCIEEAKRRWTRQEFPEVPGDHEPWVPLPA
jgi:redox-sensitive bicupin YhaK (pirin superfamily)